MPKQRTPVLGLPDPFSVPNTDLQFSPLTLIFTIIDCGGPLGRLTSKLRTHSS